MKFNQIIAFEILTILVIGALDGNWNRMNYLRKQLTKGLSKTDHTPFLSQILSYPSFGEVTVIFPNNTMAESNQFYQFFVDRATITLKLENIQSKAHYEKVCNTVLKLAQNILPEVELLPQGNGDTIVLQSTVVQTVNIILVSIAVGLLLVLVIAYCIYYVSTMQCATLPVEISWSFLMQKKYPWR